MSPGVVPGSGQDGDQPSSPAAPGNGRTPRPDPNAGWDGATQVARLIADVDAGLEQVPDEADSVPGVWFSLAGTSDPAELDLAGFAKGGLLDARPPDAMLAAVAEMAAGPGVLQALSDNQVLGLAAAGRRLAGRGAWLQQVAVAEFAARRAEPDPKKATPYGFTPFAADELVPELVVKTGAAEEAMARARDATRRLPACTALLRDGLVSAFQLQIITDATAFLTDDGAAEADTLLAAAAAGLTPSQLRVMCTRTVMMIDPAAAQRRKDSAARHARILRFQEQSGNAALCGRDLPTADVLASSQHIDACARALRAAGVPGTLAHLRVLVFLDLTKGRDPLARLAEAVDGGAGSGDGSATPGSSTPSDRANRAPNMSEPADRDPADDRWGQDEDGTDADDGENGTGGGRVPAAPGNPAPGSAGSADPGGPAASVKATVTLLVPAGTLFGWSSAPGEIPGFGLLDPQTTRDMTAAAAAHPETRWCVTVVGPDGTAAAHGCAPGHHPWIPGPHPPPGPDPPAAPGPGPGPGPADQTAQITALLRKLRVQLAPIAKGTCDHRHYSDRYVISRKVKDLIKARASTCIAPCCSRPAADTDADHTIPWPAGPSCECNIGGPCRYHHRNKQAPGWRLEQPEPGVMVWHTPSGRATPPTPRSTSSSFQAGG